MIKRCFRLSPLDALLYKTLSGTAFALIELRRFDEAVAAARNALHQNQTFVGAYHSLASALSNLGREAEARNAVARLLELESDFRISEWVKRGAQ
jgi:adenylate cyclase